MCKVVSVLICATTLGSCAAIFGHPEQGQTVRERARICFRQSQDARITAAVEPKDCYSYRCGHPSQATGTAVVDIRAYRIDFETTFHIAETKPLLGECLPDCMGGGRLDFDLGPLDPSLYDVYLWGTKQGQLSVPSGVPWQDQCFPEKESSSAPHSATPDASRSDVEAAQQSLIRFFEDLRFGDYEAAADLYGGPYGTMIEQNPDIDPGNHAALLEAACTINGAQCLEVRSARLDPAGSSADATYTFVVEFSRSDGTHFVLDSCCGGATDRTEPQTEFRFSLSKTRDHQFKVSTPPVYLP